MTPQHTPLDTLCTLANLNPTALVIPAAYHSVKSQSGLDSETQNGILIISRGTAILLLGVYVAYLYFQVSVVGNRARMNLPCEGSEPYDGKQTHVLF